MRSEGNVTGTISIKKKQSTMPKTCWMIKIMLTQHHCQQVRPLLLAGNNRSGEGDKKICLGGVGGGRGEGRGGVEVMMISYDLLWLGHLYMVSNKA